MSMCKTDKDVGLHTDN